MRTLTFADIPFSTAVQNEWQRLFGFHITQYQVFDWMKVHPNNIIVEAVPIAAHWFGRKKAAGTPVDEIAAVRYASGIMRRKHEAAEEYEKLLAAADIPEIDKNAYPDGTEFFKPKVKP